MAACRKLDAAAAAGMLSELPPSVEANERSALSPLGVEPSSSSSDVPVPPPEDSVAPDVGVVAAGFAVAVAGVTVCADIAVAAASCRPCLSNFWRRTDLRSSSSFMAFTLNSVGVPGAAAAG